MERGIRLDEVQILETYLNTHQITSDPVCRYVDARRAAILVDYPEVQAGTDDKPPVPSETPSDQPPATDQPPAPGDPDSASGPGDPEQPATPEAPVTTAVA